MDWLYESQAGKEPTAPRQQPGTDGRQRVSFGESAPPPPKVTPAPPPRPANGSATRPPKAPTQRGSGAGKPPRPPAPPTTRRRRRKHPVRRFFGVLAVLLVAWLAFLVGAPAYAWSHTTKIDAMPTGERPPEQPGDLWLLVGSDSREGLSEEERKRLGTGDIEGQRTDTILLLYVPPKGQPALISIPRDSYVAIPGYRKNKINAAYAFGGAPLLIQTVEQNTGLRVDHYAEVGFGGFVNVIEALGGIEMCPKTAIKDKFSHLDIPAGCQLMDGPTALGYVRMRYADPLGDLGRMQRQREMLAAVVKKTASPATILNPFRWWGVHHAAAQSLSTDQDTGLGALIGLAGPALRFGTGGGGITAMIPISNPNARTSAGSSMLWNEDKAAEMFNEIKRGDTSNLGRFAKLPGQ